MARSGAGEDEAALLVLARAIAAGEADVVARLQAHPALARAVFDGGATRADPSTYFLEAIRHHVYAGDTLLHVAAAAYAPEVVAVLLALGAAVEARNRRGATALHYAADGRTSAPEPREGDRAATIEALLAAGADPNARDKNGVAPLHRAVRTRSTSAVTALLAGGADPLLPNGSGNTAADLAMHTTGRSGSGSEHARRAQKEIQRLLARR